MEAGVFTARSMGELHQLVYNLAKDGYRLVAVLHVQDGDYHVVAQKGGNNGNI